MAVEVPVDSSFGDSLRDTLLKGVTVKAGALQKLGGSSLGIGAFKSWKERWVVVDGPLLKYYLAPTDDPSEKPRGVLNLDGAVISRITHPKSDSPFVFQVATAAGRKEPFVAHDESDFMSWTDTINGIVDVLAQFPGPTGRPRGGTTAGAAGPAAAAPTSTSPPPPLSADAARRASLPPSMAVGSPTSRNRSVSNMGAGAGSGAFHPHAPAGSASVAGSFIGQHHQQQQQHAAPAAAPAPAHAPAPAPAPYHPGYASSAAPLPVEALSPAGGAPAPAHAPVAHVYASNADPYSPGARLGPPPGTVGSPAGAALPAAAAPPPAAAAAKACPSCGTPASEPDALFCEDCGTRL